MSRKASDKIYPTQIARARTRAMSLVQTAPDDPTFHLWRVARTWLVDAVHAFGAGGR